VDAGSGGTEQPRDQKGDGSGENEEGGDGRPEA
jgi:hypothetical protein